MLITNIINDSFGLLSRQLKFYCWHYKHDLDQRQQQELIDILNEHYFERLANKIKSLLQSNIADCRQQIGKLLFEQCLTGDRRHQLIQLIESDLVDIDVRLDNYGRTLLHRTAYNLDVELVKLLIDHGVNIRTRDYAGNTALHIAIQSYRNGALLYSSEPAVIQNLTMIIKLLLEADRQRICIQSKSNESKILKRFESKSGTNSHAEPSKLVDSSDETEPNKESNLMKIHPSEKLINYKEISRTRDVTLCKMLGSHCACSTQVDSTNRQLKSNLSSNDVKVSESPSNPVESRISAHFILDEESTFPLVDTKNAFGRTALHYCVLVVGEQHIDQVVKLLVSYGADPDVIDTRMKTPLYCLVKRPGVAAVRQKCRAMTYLIKSGCDDLGLAISPAFFTESLIKNLESNISAVMQKPMDEGIDPIFARAGFKRVPTLMHLARLNLIKMNDELNGRLRRQMSLKLPIYAPYSLNAYVNRKILDQTELF